MPSNSQTAFDRIWHNGEEYVRVGSLPRRVVADLAAEERAYAAHRHEIAVRGMVERLVDCGKIKPEDSEGWVTKVLEVAPAGGEPCFGPPQVPWQIGGGSRDA